MNKPTPEEFEAWRGHPVTQWMLDIFVAAEMKRTRERFNEIAWYNRNAEEVRVAHRERHDTLDWLRTLNMETVNELLEQQKP